MDTPLKKQKTISTAAIILFIAALIGLGVVLKWNSGLKTDLNDNRLKSEALLSEKLSLQKDLEKFNKEIEILNAANLKLNQSLNDAKQQLAQKEAEIKAAKNDKSKLKSLEKQLAELKKGKTELENQIAKLNQNITQLKIDNEALNNTIAGLESENATLKNNLKIYTVIADNFKIENLKGKKDKLTICARRTKKISIGFDIPQSLVSGIKFKITSPEGKIYTSDNEYITTKIIDNKKELIVSVGLFDGQFEKSNRVEMTFNPKEKLSAGTYQIETSNGNKILGKSQFSLK
ncbi:MAG: hypothetical protein V1783_10385 [Bacteroidota bacterium]